MVQREQRDFSFEFRGVILKFGYDTLIVEGRGQLPAPLGPGPQLVRFRNESLCRWRSSDPVRRPGGIKAVKAAIQHRRLPYEAPPHMAVCSIVIKTR